MIDKRAEALEKLNRGILESRQEVQKRTMNLAQDYFGDSAEVLKQQIKDNRATLKDLPDQIPGGREEAFQELFQELMDNYSAMEECIKEAQGNVANLDTDKIRRQGEVDATDAARRQAKELGIDLTEIEGTGTDGRIVIDDVRNAAEAAENGAARQTQDAAGEATQQVGQAAQETQNVVGQATQQAQDAVGQAAGADEETAAPVDASDAAKREAEERGIDLSKIEGTGADGRIVYWDVAKPADEAKGGADPAEQLTSQASDAAGQAARGAQDAAGQAAGQVQQAGQVAGQAQDTAGGAAQQAQDTAGQVADQAGQATQQVQDTAGQAAEQASGAIGGITDQVGQAAGQVQDTAGGAAQQAQNAAGQATGGDGAEEPKVTNAARRKAEKMGVDLSTVKGTGSGGLITITDVTGS